MAAEPSGLRTRPGSLDELARTTGKATSNLSGTLRTMEGSGLVRLERGERGRITNRNAASWVLLDLCCSNSGSRNLRFRRHQPSRLAPAKRNGVRPSRRVKNVVRAKENTVQIWGIVCR